MIMLMFYESLLKQTEHHIKKKKNLTVFRTSLHLQRHGKRNYVLAELWVCTLNWMWWERKTDRSFYCDVLSGFTVHNKHKARNLRLESFWVIFCRIVLWWWIETLDIRVLHCVKWQDLQLQNFVNVRCPFHGFHIWSWAAIKANLTKCLKRNLF